MRRAAITAAALALATVLAACGNHTQKSANGAPAGQTVAANTSDCSPPPGAAAFAKAIAAAMVQIYGTDEAGVSYAVSQVTPEGCGRAGVVYAAKGSAPQHAEASHDASGTWYVTLFGKPYPVQ